MNVTTTDDLTLRDLPRELWGVPLRWLSMMSTRYARASWDTAAAEVTETDRGWTVDVRTAPTCAHAVGLCVVRLTAPRLDDALAAAAEQLAAIRTGLAPLSLPVVEVAA